MTDRMSLRRFAWLSIAAAVITIGLKGAAYFLTGSVGLLSDALESLVNLAAAILALVALTLAARPPDDTHEYGHDKAEYFSSGAEGVLIVIAALSIAYTSIDRLLHPQPIEQVGVGLTVSLLASLVNLAVARVLMQAGKRYESITLEADAQHLMTDVWTSVGVLVGVGVVALTGLEWLDPIIALLVALNIIREGGKLVRRSLMGLMDTALPRAEQEKLQGVLENYRTDGVAFHAIRTRQSASRRFVTMHMLVPGDWTVQRGHDLMEQVEADIARVLPNTLVTAHLEPLEDPAAWDDDRLHRDESSR
ncbi:MAG: cation diffusion facilitator family transporter [Anaerolineae bacterium]